MLLRMSRAMRTRSWSGSASRPFLSGVSIVVTVHPSRPACGWFWFAFTGDLPTLGSMFARISIPVVGAYTTLWLALLTVVVGGVVALPGIRDNRGFLVMLPICFTTTLHFTLEQWLDGIACIFTSNMVGNLLSGIVSDRLTWRRTVMFIGGIGSAVGAGQPCRSGGPVRQRGRVSDWPHRCLNRYFTPLDLNEPRARLDHAMRERNRLTVLGKIGAAFSLVLLVVVGLGGTAINRMSAVNLHAIEVRDHWLPSMQVMGALAAAFREYRLAEASVDIVGSSFGHKKSMKRLAEAQAAVETLRDSYDRLVARGTRDEQLLKQFDITWTSYMQASKEMTDSAGSGSLLESNALYAGADDVMFIACNALLVDDLAFNAAQAKQASDESARIYARTRLIVFGVVAAAAILCALLWVLLIRGVSLPIRRMTRLMKRLSENDLSVVISGLDRGDEIGDMAQSVEVFRQNLIDTGVLRQRQDQAKAAAAQQQKAMLAGMADDFEQKVGLLVEILSSASTELEAGGRAMVSRASDSDQQASLVSIAAREASSGVQSVASAAEQLSASIREITQ
jgi:methyl-accepting chemotaxis protein